MRRRKQRPWLRTKDGISFQEVKGWDPWPYRTWFFTDLVLCSTVLGLVITGHLPWYYIRGIGAWW